MVTSKTHAQAPARSLDQRMEALQTGERRAGPAGAAQAGPQGGTTSHIEEILLRPPEFVSTAKVFDMLMAVPKFGRVKAARLLNTVPDQPVQDRGRSVRAPAHRARRPLQPPLLARRCLRGPSSSSPGPSGAGKGTLIKGLVERIPALEVAVSATTRPQRPGEEDGREYWFLSDEEFERRVQAGDFLEHVAVRVGQALRDAALGDGADRGGGTCLRARARAGRCAERAGRGARGASRSSSRPTLPSSSAGCAIARPRARARSASASSSRASSSRRRTGSATWCETTISSGRRPPSRRSSNASWRSQVP